MKNEFSWTLNVIFLHFNAIIRLLFEIRPPRDSPASHSRCIYLRTKLGKWEPHVHRSLTDKRHDVCSAHSGARMSRTPSFDSILYDLVFSSFAPYFIPNKTHWHRIAIHLCGAPWRFLCHSLVYDTTHAIPYFYFFLIRAPCRTFGYLVFVRRAHFNSLTGIPNERTLMAACVPCSNGDEQYYTQSRRIWAQ